MSVVRRRSAALVSIHGGAHVQFPKFPFACVAILCSPLFAPTAIHAQETQAEKILRNADTVGFGACSPDDLNGGGCCGAPGRRWCSTLPSCTDPSSNTRRTDIYGQVSLCNLPAPSCSASFSEDQASAARKTQDFDVTFYLTSDIHYWRTAFRLPDQVRHVRLMNEFHGLGKRWPAGIGFSPELIASPLGVVMAGDLTTFGQAEELGAYRLLYEPGTSADSIAYPVYHGLGNHDVNPDDLSNAQRMFDYVGNRMVCGVSMDSASHSYSWDWNQVHIIQLNEWAGYQSDSNPACPACPRVISSGLPWLAQDLNNQVGNSGRPVILVQHLGCDSMSLSGSNGSAGTPTTCEDADLGIKPWWSAADRKAFLDVIKPYNVIGLFTGHTHVAEVHRVYDLKDRSGNEVIRLDNFVNGAGGTNDTGGSEGGHGEFYVVRVTGSYLDVLPVRWEDASLGSITLDQRRDQSTETARIDASLSRVSPAFKFDKTGCRKRIGDRFITVSPSLYRMASGGGNLVSVTNTGTQPIPGPFALRFAGSTPNISFVDSCVDESTANKSYVLFNLDLGRSLGPGSSAVIDAGVPFDAGKMELVVLTPIQGAAPDSVTLTVAPKTAVPPGSVTVYGPPNADFFAEAVGGGGVPWLTVSPAAGTFDAFGHATLTYSVNAAKLPDSSSGSVTVAIEINTSLPDAQGKPFSRTIPFSLHFKEPVTVQVTATPPSFAAPGQAPVTFKAVLTHVQVTDPVLQTHPLPSGEINLMELLPNGSRLTVSRAFLGDQAIQNSGSCTPYPDDTAIFGNDGVHNYCLSMNGGDNNPWTFALPVGMHSLYVEYEGSGSGDSYYQLGDSAPLLYRVGPPTASIRVLSGAGQSTYTGVAFDSPIVMQVLDASAHPVNGAPVAISFTSSGASATFGQSASWQGIADANGMVTSAIPFANGVAGSFTVAANVAEQGANVSTSFLLTNLAPGGPAPIVTASVLSRTTPSGSSTGDRQWTLNFRNSGGPAHGLQLAHAALAQESGTPCTPIVQTPLPLGLQALATTGSTTTGALNIGFAGCETTARFTLTLGLSANGGAYTNQIVIGHQFQ